MKLILFFVFFSLSSSGDDLKKLIDEHNKMRNSNQEQTSINVQPLEVEPIQTTEIETVQTTVETIEIQPVDNVNIPMPEPVQQVSDSKPKEQAQQAEETTTKKDSLCEQGKVLQGFDSYGNKVCVPQVTASTETAGNTETTENTEETTNARTTANAGQNALCPPGQELRSDSDGNIACRVPKSCSDKTILAKYSSSKYKRYSGKRKDFCTMIYPVRTETSCQLSASSHNQV